MRIQEKDSGKFHGQPLAYERFPRFLAVMAEDSGLSVLSSLESQILPLVPGLAAQFVRGARALDAGCGSGRLLNRLAELFPKSRFVGMDLSKEAIRAARAEASAKELKNVEFAAVDLSDFDRTAEANSFDFITTFDAVHDQSKPLNLLKGLREECSDKAYGLILLAAMGLGLGLVLLWLSGREMLRLWRSRPLPR